MKSEKEILEESAKALIDINSNIYTQIIGTRIEDMQGDNLKIAEMFDLLSFYNENIFIVEKWLDKLYPERLESQESIEKTRARRLAFKLVNNKVELREDR
jgi:hypothetical protein|tara:strand:+ start:401 stop:700 length:300 start_codon:yes stop_codon:yes gene_type:complete